MFNVDSDSFLIHEVTFVVCMMYTNPHVLPTVNVVKPHVSRSTEQRYKFEALAMLFFLYQCV